MKRKILILSVLVICLAMIAAGSLAYYTADTKAHNVITTGSVAIELNEWANEERTEKFENQTGVMPGKDVTKIVEVENVGTGSAWVCVQMFVDVYAENGKQLPTEPVKLDINTTDWTYFDGYYYYNKPLAPGATTEPLFTTVSFDEQMGNEYQNARATIDITAIAVQSANNGETVLEATGWPSFAPPEPTLAPIS